MFSYLKNKTWKVTEGEVFVNNAIGKDLLSVLRPLNLMQSLFICAKYSVRNNIITSNSFSYNLLGLVCAFGYRLLILLKLIDNIMYYPENFIVSLCLSNVYQCVSCSIGYILNYFSNIIHCNNNVLLVLKIQEVHRVLEINKKHLKSMLISNWVYVILLNCVLIFDRSNFVFMDFSIFSVMDFLSNYAALSFEINIAYATFLMNLLRKTLSVWIQQMQISRREEIIRRQVHWKEMFDVYFKILEAYKLFEKIFRLLILFYIIYSVSYSLMTVSIVLKLQLMIGHYDTVFLMYSIVTQLWVVKSIFLLVLLCVACEKFYSTMEEAQFICAQFVKLEDSSEMQKKICRNIQRLHKSSFKKMNVCGLFVVDATLPLQIAGVIYTYTLAQLQFMLPLY